jgi:hypothetical protein
LYDHEFQESRIDVNSSDLRIDYQMPTWIDGITSLNVHFFLVYGIDMRTNEGSTSLIQSVAPPAYQ